MGTGNTNDVTIAATTVVPVTGVSSTGAVGQITFVQNVDALVTGVFATGSVGSVTTAASASVIVTGVSATGRVGQAVVWGRIVPDPDTNWSGIDPGTGTVWTRIAA